MSYIELAGLEKRFGSVAAVEDFNLEVQEGEMIAFLGPSGCGKSTTLRMIAGLEMPDRGRIRLAGIDVTTTPPSRRRVGMVFQDYALFPNMTVEGNIGFGPMIGGVPMRERQDRVHKLSELVALQDLIKRYPHQLSGGQRQRVALARALATQPKVLLLDEPLSALDAPIRRSLGSEIRRIQQQIGIAAIYVTHDQEEALALADRVVVMDSGRLREVGTPQQIHRRPKSSFTARFIGSNNVFTATIVSTSPASVRCGSMVLRCSDFGSGSIGAETTLVVPSEALSITPVTDSDNALTGTIVLKTFHGPLTRLEIEMDSTRWLATLPSSQADSHAPGGIIQLFLPAHHCHALSEA
jgi:putative spermidine/putrescine transport system ATP-binding protein